MNKNYPKYAAVMLLFTFINPSFAMGGKIFKAARLIGVGTLPAAGALIAYKRDDFIEKCLFKDATVVTEPVINDWFAEKKKKLNIPNAGSISLKYGMDWFAINQTVYVNESDALSLTKRSRLKKLCSDIKRNCLIKKRFVDKATIFKFNRVIAVCDESLEKLNKEEAQNSMILNHELGHIVHQDNQNVKQAFVAIPACVETASFGVTKAFRRLCNIQQQPKTFIKTMLRSSFAIAAIVPKAIMNIAGLCLYGRYKEKQADQFACEHAESRLELEQFAKFFEELENPAWASQSRDLVRRLEATRDPIHPAPVDRKEMVQGYIDQWDRNHAHEAGNKA